MLEVSLTKKSLYNRIYESNHQNDNFDNLPFDGDEGLICKTTIVSYKLYNSIYLYQ